MGARRVWSVLGAVALAGAVVLAPSSPASADYIRDGEWTLGVFSVQDVWALSQGQGVTVAVVDSGVDGKLPDLTGQVLPGKDFTDGGQGAQVDNAGHGSFMAGIIAGHGHGAGDSSGVMGLAPKAKILPVRVGQSEDGQDLTADRWAQGIRYAVDQGASVINLSFADSAGGDVGEQAIAYAQRHDVVVVAAAGNAGDEGIDYPASSPGVVAVGSVDSSLKTVDDSNYGPGLVLAAPGDGIVGVDPTAPSGYSKADGTSDASAFVSAEAALIRARFPSLTAGQVINRMIKSATFAGNKVDKSPDEHYGYGIIRPYSALTMDIPAGPAQGPLPQRSAAPASGAQLPQAAASSGGSSSGLLAVAVVAAAVLVLLVVAAVVVVVALRRRHRGGDSGGTGGTGGPGSPGAPFPPPPYPGQVPPYGAPPQYGQPLPPYQPQPGYSPVPQPQQPPYQGH